MIASVPNVSRTLAGAAGTLLFAGLCIAAATAPANAGTRYAVNGNGERVATIPYADLDLGSPSGQKALNGRIREAARTVCAKTGNDAAAKLDEFRCIQQAVKSGNQAVMAAAEAIRTGA
jgi:UrcA family protein